MVTQKVAQKLAQNGSSKYSSTR